MINAICIIMILFCHAVTQTSQHQRIMVEDTESETAQLYDDTTMNELEGILLARIHVYLVL